MDNKTREIWTACKSVARLHDRYKSLADDADAQETFAVMQTQDYYNLYNILNEGTPKQCKRLINLMEQILDEIWDAKH